jgi:hypothetical protein
MQNKYFGDIHDLYKYILLKNISMYKSLGIHWCLVPNDKKSDGNKKLTVKEKEKCVELYDVIKNSKSKDINNIKPFFKNSTRYYDNLLVEQNNVKIYGEEAFAKLKKMDIIFFDPDNGIEVKSTNKNNLFKYLSCDLIKKFGDNGNSLIIYQHSDRIKDSLNKKITQLEKYLNCERIGNIEIVKIKNVYYIFLIQKKDFDLRDILANFINHNNKEYVMIEPSGIMIV